MAFGRDHEIARPSAVPEWLREFAEGALRRSADGSNPFQEIKGLFQRNKELGAIEERVRELKDRIGLSLVAREDAEPPATVKSASRVSPSGISRLARLANWLDERGLVDDAMAVDGVIRLLAAKEQAAAVFKKYPKLRNFVDNVVRSRGGHVSVPALLKMIRDERPEESAAASDEDLRRYIERLVEEEKREVSDGSESMAGFGVGLTTSEEDLQEDNKMFESKPPPK